MSIKVSWHNGVVGAMLAIVTFTKLDALLAMAYGSLVGSALC